MELKMEVYSPQLELLGILEGYDTLLMEDWAFKAGSFSLSTVITEENRELLRADHIIWIGEDTAGIIEYINEEAAADKVSISIKGSLLTGLLNRRILWGTYNLNASPVKIMCDMVVDCAIKPTRGNAIARKIPRLMVASPKPKDSRRLKKQQTGGKLADFLEEVGRSTATAFGIAFDASTLTMKFWTRLCIDRTIHQQKVEPVFYSTELDDVLSSSYTFDSSSYRNLAFVAGEGEGSSRKTIVVSNKDEPKGFSRHELFVDARDLQSDADPEKPMSEKEYMEILYTRGNEKIAEAQLVQNFSTSIRMRDPTYVYGVDFFLGDTITVIDERLGITIDAVVEGVERSVNKTGEDLVLNLGYGLPTLSERLRKAGV